MIACKPSSYVIVHHVIHTYLAGKTVSVFLEALPTSATTSAEHIHLHVYVLGEILDEEDTVCLCVAFTL